MTRKLTMKSCELLGYVSKNKSLLIFKLQSQATGFSARDQQDIWKILAAILHLGNIKLLDAGDGESSSVENMKEVNYVAILLGTKKDEIAHALTHRIVAAKGDVVETKLSQSKAIYGRDALAKVHTQYNSIL